MWIVEIIKLIGTISGTCKTFFGKYDKDIIYINVNNKLLGEDKRSIEEKIGLVGKKVVKISSLNDKHWSYVKI